MELDPGIIVVSLTRDSEPVDLSRLFREKPGAGVLEVHMTEPELPTHGLERASRFAEEMGLTLRLRRTTD